MAQLKTLILASLEEHKGKPHSISIVDTNERCTKAGLELTDRGELMASRGYEICVLEPYDSNSSDPLISGKAIPIWQRYYLSEGGCDYDRSWGYTRGKEMEFTQQRCGEVIRDLASFIKGDCPEWDLSRNCARFKRG